ncbi:MAG: methyltransferase domain-containing protein [Planctomycetes bacterium]|nr:methyltransferase domain-containing protein [Planctomycetota bacterium]
MRLHPPQERQNFVAKKSPQPTAARTLGPIPDLERHLPSDWWRTLFTSLYLKTDGDVVENDQNTVKEVDLLIKATGLEPNDKVLDLCCGQGRHSLELAKRGFRNVTGVDRSRYLIRLARKRSKAAGFSVSFHEGDARKFSLPESSMHTVCMMGNSFGYFDRVSDDLVVLNAIKRVLVSGGTLAMDLVDGDWMKSHFEKRSWEWIDEDQFVARERSLASDGERLISREVVVHAERGIIADQFYGERLYSRKRIIELLTEAGFTGIRFHGTIEGESTRGQDLGMMANRIFLTATAPRKVAAAPRGILFPEVTVLLGDPSLPDAVKKDGQFNPEDLETIDKLKESLAELHGYSFKYVNHHNALLQELKNNPPKFVLNLCDEGYYNDPYMELHVPALLEVTGVPYTGAGPACLGLCYNKNLVRAVADSLDIPVPLETYFDPDDTAATLPSSFPALCKPNFGDASVGITKDAVVHNPDELVAYLKKLRDEFPGRPVLIQEYLTGPEYSVTIVGNPGMKCRVLPILEVDYSQLPKGLPPILGYESKWLPDSPYWTHIKHHQAKLEEDQKRRMGDYSMHLFERLGCQDYARFDYRADAHGTIKLLEANPNCGWCWDGKMNYMAGFAGMRYADLLREILEAAQTRIASERNLRKVTGKAQGMTGKPQNGNGKPESDRVAAAKGR